MLRIALEGGLVSVSLMMIYHKRHIGNVHGFSGRSPVSATGDLWREKEQDGGIPSAESRRPEFIIRYWLSLQIT